MFLRGLLFPFCCGAALLSATDVAHAVILAEDFFSYPNGLLAGQTPSPGPGGTWVGHDDPGSHPALVSGGKAVLNQFFGGGGHEDVSVPIGVQDAGALLFARFDFMLPSSTNLTGDPLGLNRGSDPPTPLDSNGLYFAHFKSDEPTTQFRARTGIVQPTSGGDFGLAINANGQNLGDGVTWATDLSFDTTYRAVISWDGTTGESKLWLDPTEELSTSISHTVVPFGQQMEAFALRQNNDYDGQQIIDDLVVATTFAEALAGSGFEPPTLRGDYNDNGVLDAADYTVWRDAYPDGALINDDDGMADDGDFTYWRDHFGETLGGGAGSGASGVAAATVPEPSGLLLAVLGIALICAGRFRAAARVAA